MRARRSYTQHDVCTMFVNVCTMFVDVDDDGVTDKYFVISLFF